MEATVNTCASLANSEASCQALASKLAPAIAPESCDASQRCRRACDRAAVGIFRTSLDGRFLQANPKLAAILGYASDEELRKARGNTARRIYVDPDRRADFARVVQRNGAIMNFESQIRRRDGSTAWISENAWAVYDSQGQIQCYEGFVEEIAHGQSAVEPPRTLPHAAGPFDLAGFLARCLGDAMFCKIILNKFADRADDLLARLNRAVESRRPAELAAQAHTLKGLAANFSADELQLRCDELEQAARCGDVSGCALLIERVKAEFGRCRQAVPQALDWIDRAS